MYFSEKSFVNMFRSDILNLFPVIILNFALPAVKLSNPMTMPAKPRIDKKSTHLLYSIQLLRHGKKKSITMLFLSERYSSSNLISLKPNNFLICFSYLNKQLFDNSCA